MRAGAVCRLLLWVTAVSRQMPPPGSGAVKEGESVPDLNLECARNLPACLRAHRACEWVFFRVAGAPDTGTGGPDDRVWGWAFEAQVQWEQHVGRAAGHPAEEPWSLVCWAWCMCETHGKWTRFGRSGGPWGLRPAFQDPYTVLSGLQGAAGTGLGGDLLFELLVFPEFWGVPWP